jgi:hypothetical protein
MSFRSRLRPGLSALLPTLVLALAAPRSASAKGPQWTAEDSVSAARFMDAFVKSPEKIDSLTSGPGDFGRDHDLGFGYRLREAWVNAAGKLGFAFKIVYEGKKPVSFEAKPVINYAALRARCRPLLAPVFGQGNGEDTYVWNLEAAAAPLAADSLGREAGPPAPEAPDMRKALAYYMSPYSGILYGVRGGDNGQLLENRDRFLGLGDFLMLDKSRARYLLRSVNPASRLTAAEFIIRHRVDFPDYDELMRTSMAFVFSHPSKAATMRGPNVTEEDARKLAFEYARVDVRRDGRGVMRLY